MHARSFHFPALSILFICIQLWMYAAPAPAAAALPALSLSMPQVVDENSGQVSGTVSVASTMASNLFVTIDSDNPSELLPGSVMIPAGTNLASFSLSVADDHLLDGVQTVALTAHASGYEADTATVFIHDNEEKRLFLDLPTDAFEGAGTLINAGMVYVDGVAVTDLHILLQSSDNSEASVPLTVTITAGHSNAVFSITAIDDDEVDGRQYPTITASVPGYDSGASSMGIGDNEFGGFAISALDGNVPGNVPFMATIQAANINGEPVPSSFSGSVTLSALISSNAVAVEPADPISIDNGAWQGVVTIHGAGEDAHLLVDDGAGRTGAAALNLYQLNVVKMEPDYGMPYIYLLHTASTGPMESTLLWYNTGTDAIEVSQDAGINASDLTVHYTDNRIYASTMGVSEVAVFDRLAKARGDDLVLHQHVYRIGSGPAGLVVSEDDGMGNAYYARLHLWDNQTGASIQNTAQYTTRRGTGESDTTGRYYYHVDAQEAGYMRKYDMASGILQQIAQVSTPKSARRELIISGDGSHLFWKGSVYDSDLILLSELGQEIYAASANGELALTQTEVLNGVSGESIYTLPFSTDAMAFSGDQSKLLLYDPATYSLTSAAATDIVSEPSPDIIPVPAVGSIETTSLSEVSWSRTPLAFSYDVYVGTDSNAVATADTNSPVYFGRQTDSRFIFPEGMLAGGQTYYWRIDQVGYGERVVQGYVWYFHTPAIVVDPLELEVPVVQAPYTQSVSIAIDSSVGVPAPWSATSATNWLVLGQTSGTAPSTLNFYIDASQLETGVYSTSIQFSDGSRSFSVPVSVDVHQMRIVKMATDWTLPYIYMLHTSSSEPNQSILIWYNTASDSIEQVLPAGENATDLAVHYGDNRIYVIASETATVPVFDRILKVPVEDLTLGKQQSRLAAGPVGRLVSEYADSDQMSLWNSATGTRLVRVPNENPAVGTGESDTTGRYYYHVDQYLQYAPYLSKYDLSNDTFTQIETVRVEKSSLLEIIISGDGSRVFWGGSVYDADLNPVASLGQPIYASSVHGELAVTQTEVLSGTSGESMYSLPFSSDAMAFSGDQSKLVLFNPATYSLDSIAVSNIMDAPLPMMIPGPEVDSVQTIGLPRLSWSGAPLAIAYDVYIGTESNGVASANTNAALYYGRMTDTEMALPEALLEGNQTYYWRVDPVGFDGNATPGDLWYFHTSAIDVVPRTLNIPAVVAAYTQTMSIAVNRADGAQPAAWTASCPSGWLSLGQTNGTAPGQLDIQVDVSSLSAGEYTTQIEFSDGSRSFAIPVRVNVQKMRITKMETDWQLPYIYMLHVYIDPVTYAIGDSMLIWYNTDTGSIENVKDVGEDARDLAIHYGDNRIYTAFYSGEVHAYDRITGNEVASLVLDSQIHEIYGAPPGRILTHTRDMYGYINRINMYDATDGSLVTYQEHSSNPNLDYGDNTPDGRILYFRAENAFRKFAVTPDSITVLTTGTADNAEGLGASMDGSRVYAYGKVYDSDLNQILNIGSQINAISAYGNMAVTGSGAFNVQTGTKIYTLPFSTSVMAFSSDQSKLVLFNNNGSLATLSTSEMMDLPSTTMTPDPANGSVVGADLSGLSWSAAPLGYYYDVYFGADSNTVAGAAIGSAEYLGRLSTTEMALPAGLLSADQSYYWRVDAVEFGGEIVQSRVWGFETTAVSVEPGRIMVDGVVAGYTQTVSVAVSSAVGSNVSWSASCESGWVTLSQSNGMTDGVLDLEIDVSALPEGSYEAELVISDGYASLIVPISISVVPMNIVKMEADWMLPYIYMLHTSESAPNKSLLIWYNTAVDRIDHVVDAGENATDLTVHYGDDGIYVNNWKRLQTRRFDRVSRKEQDPLLIGNGVYTLEAGRSGRVYAVGEDWITNVRAFNTANGIEVAQTGFVDGGDEECTLDGRYLYFQEADTSPTIRKYDVSADTFTSVASHASAKLGSLFVSIDGLRVFHANTIYDGDLNPLHTLGSSMYAASAYGDLVVSQSKAYSGVTGEELYTLPFASAVMAFSGDQSSLVMFNAGDHSLASIDVGEIMPIPEPGMVPDPADGEIVGANLPGLSWSAHPVSIGYDVYVGVDSNAVATADTNSVEYLGRATTTDIGLPPGSLAGSQTYYWRVDAVTFGEAVTASRQWHFQTASISLDPYEMKIYGMAASYTQMVAVAVNSAATGSVAWTATCSSDWVVLPATNGTTPEVLEVGFDMTGMTPGSYTAEIVFDDGSRSVPLAVALTVESMQLVNMTTDWARPYIYMLHTSTTDPNQSLLIWYNTDADGIERVLYAGENANDLSVNYADDRIFVNNYEREETRVFDRSLKSELGPLSFGSGVYKLNAGPSGVLFTEGFPESTQIIAWDADTQAQLASKNDQHGDGEFSLDGRYYYHGDRYYNPTLSKFDFSTTTFNEIASVKTRGSGSNNVLVSGDGERVFQTSAVYDARTLTEILYPGEEMYAVSFYGRYAITASGLIDVDSGETVLALTGSGEVSAFSYDQRSLALFDAATAGIHFISLMDIGLPEPALQPVQENGTIVPFTLPRLEWSEPPFAYAYDVYLGVDSNGVASATTNSTEYMGRTESDTFPMADGMLEPGGTYYWRIDAIGADGVLDSDIWSFAVSSVGFGPAEFNAVLFNIDGLDTLSLEIDMLDGSTAWEINDMPAWISASPSAGLGSATVTLTIDKTLLGTGSRHGMLTLLVDGVHYAVPVHIRRLAEVIKCMTPHPSARKVYAVSYESGGYESYLLEIGQDPLRAERILELPLNITDIDIEPGHQELYAISYNEGSITRVDLDSLTIADSRLAPGMSRSGAGRQYDIEAGIDGRIYYVDDEWAPRIHVFDYANGADLFKYDLNGNGIGDIVYSDSTNRMYLWRQFGWGAGNANSWVYTLDCLSNQFSIVERSSVQNRDPLDTPILLVKEGQSVICKKRRFDTADLASVQASFSQNIYSATPDGLLAVGTSKIFNATNGVELASLPLTSRMHVCLSDSSAIVWYDGTSQTMGSSSFVDLGIIQAAAESVETSSEFLSWQSEYFPDQAMESDAMADGDGDGLSNLEEYIAGSDPTSAESYFAMHDAFTLPDGRMVIWWDSVTGRVYSVYWTPSLTESFQLLENNLFYPQHSYTDQVERVEQSGFYKVGVELE